MRSGGGGCVEAFIRGSRRRRHARRGPRLGPALEAALHFIAVLLLRSPPPLSHSPRATRLTSLPEALPHRVASDGRGPRACCYYRCGERHNDTLTGVVTARLPLIAPRARCDALLSLFPVRNVTSVVPPGPPGRQSSQSEHAKPCAELAELAERSERIVIGRAACVPAARVRHIAGDTLPLHAVAAVDVVVVAEGAAAAALRAVSQPAKPIPCRDAAPLVRLN